MDIAVANYIFETNIWIKFIMHARSKVINLNPYAIHKSFFHLSVLIMRKKAKSAEWETFS